MQIENLKEFLLVSSIIEPPTKLEMDLNKLMDKCDFTRLLKDHTTKNEEDK
jgi:hypothetical protein